MKLVIAEKAALGRDIARAICGRSVSESARLPISGNGYTVVACAGHLMRLQEPSDIDKAWGKPFNLDVLPIAPDPWPSVPDPGKADLINTIEGLLAEADEVIHAGDPDDEGQLIVDEVLDHLGYEGPVTRVYVNDNIEKNILRAFDERRDNAECRRDGEAARARSWADMCFGVNESRLATLRCNTMLTLGRVQTPTLGLVVKRDEAIAGHAVSCFYEVLVLGADEDGVAHTFKLKADPALDALDDKGRIVDKSEAERIASALTNEEHVFKTERAIKREKAPLPHDLTSLTVEMGRRAKFGAQKTLDVTQALREKYKAITYNRTDSRYLKEEHFAEAKTVLKAALANAKLDLDLDFTIHGPAFNDERVSAHHAIIPTEARVDVAEMTADERAVYLAITERYAEQFAGDAVYDVATSTSVVEGTGELKLVQRALLEPGWKAIASDVPEGGGEDDDGSGGLDDDLLEAGTHELRGAKGSVKERQTTPPKPYTESSLITDMVNIAKYVDDPDIKAILKARKDEKGATHGGIGTVATRAAIIENLKKRGYIEEVKGKIRSTERGRGFFHLIPSDIKGPDVTAAWSLIQEEVAAGRAPVSAVMCSVVEVFESHKDTAYQGANLSGSASTVLGRCPLCGQDVIARGPKQKAVQCASNKFQKNDETGAWEQKEGCGFKVFRTIAGKKLTDAQIKTLLEKGRTSVMKGFKPKTGKSFEAALRLDEKTGSVELVFSAKSAPKRR